MPAAAEDESDLQRVCRWRREQLEDAGYDREAADVLANRLDINLHVAVTLLADGCDERTALTILL